jgi:hypothetical protein
MTTSITNYQATKTASEFHQDSSRVRLMMGPVGSGKSVADCIEVFIRGTQQAPGDDGIRRSRWAIIRNTYPELKATTIKTWQEWFPAEHFGSVKFDSPISHRIRYKNIDLEVFFIALDSVTDIKKLMSFELTGVYINEMQFIPKQIFDICLQRINRYPSKKSGAPITFTGLIADTNPPDNDHWIYKLFEENKPHDYAIFKYEPALSKVNEAPTDGTKHATSLNGSIYINNPAADYRLVQNDPNYWINLVSGYTDEQIKVYLQGEYGTVIDGRPVHPEYNDSLHFANKEIEANPLVEIGLGWDFGMTPACSIVQLMPNGYLAVIDELYSDDMHLRDFAELIVIPHLDKHYPFWRKNYISRHDPAGSYGSQTDGKHCQQILFELGIKSSDAASSNASTPRRDGLKYFLRRLVGGYPGYQLSSKCNRLRKALMGHYQYARMKVSGDDRYHEQPLKNIYSHIAEAHEYICMHYARNEKVDTTEQDNTVKLLANRFKQRQQSRSRASWHTR